MNQTWMCGFWHQWWTVDDNGFTVYRQCLRCGKREVFQGSGGYQPIREDWIPFYKGRRRWK